MTAVAVVAAVSQQRQRWIRCHPGLGRLDPSPGTAGTTAAGLGQDGSGGCYWIRVPRLRF
uniref:Uncharacterized protein n=1 Tax=Oryza barthii TaxID=65489 RepID=A0A0D3GPL7_9ORYZ